MLEIQFPFFISKKLGEILIFGTFLAKNGVFFVLFFSILVYFHWKSAFWARPCLKTSFWRHTLTDFHDFLSPRGPLVFEVGYHPCKRTDAECRCYVNMSLKNCTIPRPDLSQKYSKKVPNPRQVLVRFGRSEKLRVLGCRRNNVISETNQ